MVNYPSEFPTEALSTVMSVVAEGSWADKKDEFAHAAWNLQGYLQSTFLPLSGGNDFSPLAQMSTLDDESALEAFQVLSTAQPSNEGEFKALSLSLPVPATMLLQWLLGKLLEEIIK